MNLTVTNIGAIRRAEIEISRKITLVVGPNGAGKTTMARLAGAIQSGDDRIFSWPDGSQVLKKDSHSLLHKGAKEGAAILKGVGSVTVTKATIKVAGGKTHPLVSGLMRWSRMTFAERLEAMGAAFQLEPTQEMVTREMLEMGVPAAVAGMTKSKIDTSLQGKRQEWCSVTGASRYPSAMAKAWKPAAPEWATEFFGIDPLDDAKADEAGHTLNTKSHNAFHRLSDASHAGVQNPEKMAELQAFIDEPTADLGLEESALEELQEQLDDVDKKIYTIVESVWNGPETPIRLASPDAPQMPPFPVPPSKHISCQWCGETVPHDCDASAVAMAEHDFKVAQVRKSHQEALDSWRDAVAKVAAHNEAVSDFEKERQEKEKNMQALLAEKQRLLDARSVQDGVVHRAKTADDRKDLARQQLEEQQKKITREQYEVLQSSKDEVDAALSGFIRWVKACRVHADIQNLERAKEGLEKSTLRRRLLDDALADVNREMARLLDGSGAAFFMGQEMEPVFSEAGYRLLSGAQVAVFDALVQLVFAQRLGVMAVIDAADLPKKPLSRVFFGAIDWATVAALVFYAGDSLPKEHLSFIESSAACYRLTDGETNLVWER